MPERDDDRQGKQRRQARSAVALGLASGRTVAESAEAGGVSTRTCYRWMRQPGFNRKVAHYRSEMLRAATGRLASSMTAASETLTALLGEDNPPAVRLRAADLLLSHGVKLDEAVNVRAKLAELEQLVKGATSWAG